LGIGVGESGTVGAARSCTWRKRGDKVTTFVGVGILEDRGLSDLPANVNPRALPDIGRHEARSVEGGDPDSCQIVLGVSPESRVDITVLIRTDRAAACALTDEVARLVEPELP